jgi:hypothetical protein
VIDDDENCSLQKTASSWCHALYPVSGDLPICGNITALGSRHSVPVFTSTVGQSSPLQPFAAQVRVQYLNQASVKVPTY